MHNFRKTLNLLSSAIRNFIFNSYFRQPLLTVVVFLLFNYKGLQRHERNNQHCAASEK